MSHPRPDPKNRIAARTGVFHLFALLGYALLTVIMTWPLALNLTGAIPGDGFDGWQNYWNLWWVKVALVERIQNPLITDLLYHPTGVGLYFHTLNPFNGLATLPVQLSAGLIPAYNAVVFVSWVLGGYGLFLLTLWVLGGEDQATRNAEQRAPSSERDRPQPRAKARFSFLDFRASIPYFSAFVAGAIFTFSPFHMAHLLGHMQVMSLQWIAFYILYLLRAMKSVRSDGPWLRSSLMAGGFLVLTGLCDWYFVLYLLFFTLIVLGWQGIGLLAVWIKGDDDEERRSSHGGRLWLLVRLAGPAAVAGMLFAIVLSPWLVPMVRQSIHYSFMVRPQSDLYILSASVADFFVPNRLHALLRPASFSWIGNQIAPVSERTISIGYLTLGLAAVGLFARSRAAWLWAITALIFFALALGPIIHFGNITWDHIPADTEAQLHLTPMGILNYYLPIARISRSISRYALMVQLSMAVLAGLGTATLLTRRRSPRSSALVGSLVLVGILAESWVAPYPLSAPDTPDYYTQILAQNPGDGAILNLPMNYDRPGYLLYQTVHGRPLTIAYISRDDPRTLTERLPVLQHFRRLGPDIIDIDPATIGATVLADIGVEQVVLDRYKMPGGEERAYTTALAESIFAAETPLYEDDRLSVYAVEAPDRPQPYLSLGAENWGSLEGVGTLARARPLADGPAKVYLHHAPGGSQLRIRYRTAPGVTIAIATEEGKEIVAVLPSTPESAEVTFDLAAVLGANGADTVDVVIVEASAADGAWIEELELVLP